jgi:hypothetical protein
VGNSAISFITWIEQPLGGVVFSGNGSNLIGYVSPGIDLTKTGPHARADAIQGGVAESPRSILGFLSMAGEATMFHKVPQLELRCII